MALVADALSVVLPETWRNQLIPHLTMWGGCGSVTGSVVLARLRGLADDESGRAAYFDWIDQLPRGTVAVVQTIDVAGAVLGDLVARRLVQRHVAGFVTSGMVRDVSRLRQLPLRVWGVAAVPDGGLRGPLAFDAPQYLPWGPTPVATGDWFVGDPDGIIIVPSTLREEVNVVMATMAAHDAATAKALDAGIALRDAYPSKGRLPPASNSAQRPSSE